MDSPEAIKNEVLLPKDNTNNYSQLGTIRQERQNAHEHMDNYTLPLNELLRDGSYDTFWQRLNSAYAVKYKDQPDRLKKATKHCTQNQAELGSIERKLRGQDRQTPPSAKVAVEWYRKLGAYNNLREGEAMLKRGSETVLRDKRASDNERLIGCQMLSEAAEVVDKRPNQPDFVQSRSYRAEALMSLADVRDSAESRGDNKTAVEAHALAVDIYFTDLLQVFRNQEVDKEVEDEQVEFLQAEIQKLLQETEAMFVSHPRQSDVLGMRSEIAMASLVKMATLLKRNWDEVYSSRMATLREDRPTDGIALSGRVSMRPDQVQLPPMSYDLRIDLINPRDGKFDVSSSIYQLKAGSEVKGYDSSIVGLAMAKVFGGGGIDTIMKTLSNPPSRADIVDLQNIFLGFNETLGGREPKYYDLADKLYISQKK